MGNQATGRREARQGRGVPRVVLSPDSQVPYFPALCLLSGADLEGGACDVSRLSDKLGLHIVALNTDDVTEESLTRLGV